jgi:Leucine-rich repeat (LRR) protein
MPTKQNIASLARLTDLVLLLLNDNQISDITPLMDLTNLKVLWLDDNQIRNIEPLADMRNLFSLYLDNNLIILLQSAFARWDRSQVVRINAIALNFIRWGN